MYGEKRNLENPKLSGYIEGKQGEMKIVHNVPNEPV